MSELQVANTNCNNCNASLGDLPGKYCPNCAQETNLEPLHLGEYVGEFAGHYLAPGGKLAKTVWRLLSRPGQLTLDYREGRRNQYVRPLRLVLIVVVLTVLFGKFLETVGPSEVAEKAASRQAEVARAVREKTLANPPKHPLAARTAEEIAALSMPGKDEIAAYHLKLWKFQEALRLYTILLIAPIVALIFKWLFWNRQLRYGDFLVFTLHLSCAYILVSQLILLPSIFALDNMKLLLGYAIVGLLAITVYLFLALQRLYGGRPENTIARTVVAQCREPRGFVVVFG